MIRRLFVLSVALGCLLLLCVGSVKGQSCTPSNQPTLGGDHQIFTPNDWAAQGGATVTVTQELAHTGIKNHAAEAGVGTDVTYRWSSNHVASVSAYYTLDGGSQHYTYGPITGLSGSSSSTFGQQSWIGHYLTLYVIGYDSGGHALAQDRITQIYTGNSPGDVVGTDNNDSNLIVLISGTYSGTPQIDFNTCSQATEKPATPTANITASNLTSGENQSASNAGATGVIDDQFVLNANTSAAVSALPGDTITGNIGGSTFCTAIGNIFADVGVFRVEIVKTITNDLGHPGTKQPDGSVAYEVAPICDFKSDPADWAPNVVLSTIGRYQFWYGITECFRFPDAKGNPWKCLADFMDQVATWTGSSSAKLLAIGSARPYNTGKLPFGNEPIPGPCTNYDRGANILGTWSPTESPIPYPW